MNITISAFLLTKNEERNLPDCLESLSWVNEIVVVDDESSDRTVEIARSAGCKVVVQGMKSYPEQRALGISHCSHDWILWLDADERITPTLRKEIQTRLSVDANKYTAYYVLRQEFLLGRSVNYTDWGARYYWGKTYHLRLFRKDRWCFKPDQKVHERLEGEGPVGRLYHLLHHTNANPDLDTRFNKTVRYARLEAEMRYQCGFRVKWYDFIFRPLLGFFKSFVWFRGFMDGVNGLVIAWCNLITQVCICSYVYEKQEEMTGLEVRKREIQSLWRNS